MFIIVDNAVAFPNFAKDDIFKYCFAKAKEGSLKMLISCVFYPKKKMYTQTSTPMSALKKDTYRKRTSSLSMIFMES